MNGSAAVTGAGQLASPRRLTVPPPRASRALRGALVALTGTLAVVYLLAGATTGLSAGLASLGEAAAGLAELTWLLALRRSPGPRALSAGIVLQAGLVVLWILTRTTGLPGVGRPPVGEFDALCVADAIAIAAIAARLRAAARAPLGLCQLAALLAGATVFLGMTSLMSMDAPTAAAGGWLHGAPAHPFFCHLL